MGILPVIAAVVVSMVVSCGHKNRTSSDAAQKPHGDDERLGDDGEGIYGYLTDPTAIAISAIGDGDRLRIEAPAGCVAYTAPTNGFTGSVAIVHVPQGSSSAVSTDDGGSLTITGATTLATITIANDGGFAVEVRWPGSGALIVSLQGGANDTVFKAPARQVDAPVTMVLAQVADGDAFAVTPVRELLVLATQVATAKENTSPETTAAAPEKNVAAAASLGGNLVACAVTDGSHCTEWSGPGAASALSISACAEPEHYVIGAAHCSLGGMVAICSKALTDDVVEVTRYYTQEAASAARADCIGSDGNWKVVATL